MTEAWLIGRLSLVQVLGTILCASSALSLSSHQAHSGAATLTPFVSSYPVAQHSHSLDGGSVFLHRPFLSEPFRHLSSPDLHPRRFLSTCLPRDTAAFDDIIFPVQPARSCPLLCFSSCRLFAFTFSSLLRLCFLGGWWAKGIILHLI